MNSFWTSGLNKCRISAFLGFEEYQMCKLEQGFETGIKLRHKSNYSWEETETSTYHQFEAHPKSEKKENINPKTEQTLIHFISNLNFISFFCKIARISTYSCLDIQFLFFEIYSGFSFEALTGKKIH